MAVNYIDSGLGWAADAAFYKLEAGNIAAISGRVFHTYLRGPIVFATVYLPATGYTGPVVISTNRDYAAYEPGGVVAQGRFDYLSFTWYITAFSGWMSGNQVDSSGISQKLTISGSAAAEVGVAVLKAASVVPTEYSHTSATKIYYNGSSKVIKRLCQVINSVARLGTSHDKAFYGDLGQEAYDHSQTTGNPHGLTLADLGIDNIQRQIDFLMDAATQFTGASGATAGTAGIVPAPNAEGRYLSSEGVWAEPDTAPVPGSPKLITSGAVRKALDNTVTSESIQTALDYTPADQKKVDTVIAGASAYAAGLRVQNLLDNSDFTNPVNQRGQTSYTVPWGYAFDRWILGHSNVSNGGTSTANIVAGGIQLVNNNPAGGAICIQQHVAPEKIDKSVAHTLAVCDAAGNINITIYSPGNIQSMINQFGFLPVDCNFAQSNIKIKWAALYPGQYTLATLPPYVPKGYGAELAECLRYFYRSWDGTLRLAAMNAVFAGADTRSTSIDFPVPMRINPTITLYNPVTGHSGTVGNWADDSDVSANPVYVTNSHFIIGGPLVAGKMYQFSYKASAEL